jgi:Tol biopolymer transport system component
MKFWIGARYPRPSMIYKNKLDENNRNITRKNIFVLLLLSIFFIYTPLFAQFESSHPELEWQTFDTEHFQFHFHQGTKRTAFTAAKIIEDIYPAVTDLYDFKPEDKIHVIIKDTDDYSNGGAYFFNNKMEIWTTNLDYVMRGTKNWLRDVMTHEFTHMVSIQKTIKTNLSFPYGFFQWFGYEKEQRKDVVRGFPNLLVTYPLSSISMPVWFAEGVAQQQGSYARFDYRDPHREMIIRDRILNDQLLTYNEMSVFGKTSHGNESSYNLGFSFSKYLADRFGEKILSDITRISSKWSSYTFNGVLEEATGIPVDQLYSNWKDSLTQVYRARTKIISQNEQKGKAVETKGFSNLYPVLSPDASKIAYVSNKGHDYFSQSSLIVYDRKNHEKKVVASGVVSSLSWSPDGRYIAYAAKDENKYGSKFDDLYLYDFDKDESIRLTWNLRGNNPDFSKDGKKLTFVTTTNGLNQLNVYHLPEDLSKEDKAVCAFNVETGTYSADFTDEIMQREVRYLPGRIEQVLAFADGRQIYHPRWSNDDAQIVFGTAVEYGRNLGVYNIGTATFDLFMQAEEELRYPVFQPGSDWLYYSASTTGIYNLYRYNLKTKEKELLSNVTGGAFMPSVAANGDIAYACYDSIGYHIYELNQPQKVDPALAVYDENYIESIPDKNFDDAVLPEFTLRPDKQTFTNTLILPRLFIDYETVKPGFYLVASDVMDELTLIAGGAVNSDFDYDLYGNVTYRKLPKWFIPSFSPSLFAEAFNINANIKDEVIFHEGFDEQGNPTNTFSGKRNVNFNLLQVSAGTEFELLPKGHLTLGYIRSIYRANLNPVIIRSSVPGPKPLSIPTIRYTYLKGHSFQAKFSYNGIGLDRFNAINPSSGFYLFAKFGHESVDFLTGFNTSGSKQIGLEQFKTWVYNSYDLSAEYYIKNPLIKSHTLGLFFKGGYLDRPVNSFFNYFAGGILGLKGYPFYSIEGRQKLIGSATYRFPIHRNLDWKLGHLQFDKLYAGLFYEYGDAFDGSEIKFENFKRDVGVELRLDSFSYNLFPTRVFFQAAWPIDEVQNFDQSRDELINYPQEWRYYLGVLFEFDLRERFGSLIGSRNSALGKLKFW